MKKRYAFLAALLMVCLLLSGCSKGADMYQDKYANRVNPEVAVEAAASIADEITAAPVKAEAEAQMLSASPFDVSYEDFRYDGKVGWNSSYSDIISLYGKPDEVVEVNGLYIMTYKNRQVCGYPGYNLSFRFDRKKEQLLTQIDVKKTYKTAADMYRETEDIRRAFVSKYGEPNSNIEQKRTDYILLSYQWNKQIEDAWIGMSSSYYETAAKEYKIFVEYHSVRDTAKRPVYSDLPEPAVTPTPAPAPTKEPEEAPTREPTATPDNSGI